MAIYPGARVRLIPPGANDPRIIVIGAILHTDAGNSPSLYGYFNGPSGGVESHFHVPKVYQVEQYRDTAFEADANYHGNSFELNGKLYGYASIETQGYETDAWNDYQLAEIKELLVWLSETHRFPLVKCASATSPGVGYHTMWGAPGPWTPVAKTCPGAKRIAQFNFNLVPWFSNPTTPEEDMTDAQYEALLAKAEAARAQAQSATSIAISAVELIKSVAFNQAALTTRIIAEDDEDDAVAAAGRAELKALAVELRAKADVAQADIDRIETAVNQPAVDPAALAAAIVAALPASETIDQATVEAGVRAVLGGLDEPVTP